MLTRHQTTFKHGHSVVPHVRVAAGKATLLEMAYEWDGVKGVIPLVALDLTADLADDKVYLVAVYRNSAGERRVVTDSRVVKPGPAGESSADAILHAQGWERCFLVFQTFVPAGLTGPVEEENSMTQVFEHVSRPDG